MKKFITLFLSLAMVLTLAACGSGSGGSGSGSGDASGSADSSTIKVHLSAGTTDTTYFAGEKFKELVEEKSGGKVTVELYPSSSLGTTADCLEGLSTGAVDIVYDSIANLSAWSDISNIDAAPYLYNDVDHYRAVWEGDVGRTILDAVGEECGNRIVLAAGLQGIRELTTTSPVNGPDDVVGMKLRVPTISIYLDTWTWLGATPTPLAAADVFTAIQQGTVDGQENPYPACVGLSIHECCKYVTETNHVYSSNAFILDSNAYAKFPEDVQKVLKEAAEETAVYQTDIVVDITEEKKQTFVDAGATIIETDISAWQAKLDGFLDEKYPALAEYADMIAAAK